MENISNELIKHYKCDEVQEFMNAPLGDPNLTETKRGQMETQVSHVCGEQELKKKILNKFIDRITYYEKQKLTLPRSEKIKSRIRELKYMMKEIDNIFFENDSRKSG